jgi:tetratricopeptide (TPR) repeat protein
MKHVLMMLFLCLFGLVGAQNTKSTEQIRALMAKIRQTTNWDDPAAAKKANEEIKKLAQQLNGGQTYTKISDQNQQQSQSNKPVDIAVNTTEITKDKILAIAQRFFQRSYNTLDAVTKSAFDRDYDEAKNTEFSRDALLTLKNNGAALITFGNDHNIACVYIASAVIAKPEDTLALNNFGGYLRIIDSVKQSLPVLLYANKIYNQSPVILTQIGCSYLELNDNTKGESYLKEALKYNPGFGQAHSALCDLYIKQGRLQDAILELFAGVKGMGASYNQATSSFQQIQAQYQGSEDSKNKFWDETKNQVDPSEALAPLVPGEDQVKMPDFPDCPSIEAWQRGGGYSWAVGAYSDFHSYLMSFAYRFQEVHKEAPSVSGEAILIDYPDGRFALDCITEMFARESNKKADDYKEKLYEIVDKVNRAKEEYLENLQLYADELKSCAEGCGGDGACVEECHRRFCARECPNTNQFNSLLKSEFEQWQKLFNDYVNDQSTTLDDLYGFSSPWLDKIKSPYWYRVYSFEVKRVALLIVGNCYGSYPQAFQSLSDAGCGSDCSVWAATFEIPGNSPEVNKKDPKSKDCPDALKFKVSFIACDAGFDCQSIEFGCTEGLAFSAKRNFKKKSTTFFVGVGAKGDAGYVSGSIKGGLVVTVNDNKEVTDVGGKFDASASVGLGDAKIGVSSKAEYTVMKGFNTELNPVVTGKTGVFNEFKP